MNPEQFVFWMNGFITGITAFDDGKSMIEILQPVLKKVKLYPTVGFITTQGTENE